MEIHQAINNLKKSDLNSVSVAQSVIESIATVYKEGQVSTLVPILPLFLALKGQPFSLKNHFPFEPLYKVRDIPRESIVKCGRQVSKSTTIAARGVIFGAIHPNLNQMFVTPLFEQVRRFSNNFVKPFIQTSPLNNLLTRQGFNVDNSVFQRTFSNGSNMFFTFAFLDAERARGIAADILNLDEVQDMDTDFIPVLSSCLDASDMGIIQYSGTPKTTDNTIHSLWEQSSQAHWVMKCDGCSEYNVAGLEFGIDKMIRVNGFCCLKCGKKLDPTKGFYKHMFADRIHTFPGYHVPQCILPMHYANEEKWFKLYSRSQKWPRYRFLNEILGESCDVGTKLVTRTKLMEIARLPWSLNVDEAVGHVNDYAFIYMGVDWGGGGGGTVKKRRNQLIVEGGTTSFTVLSITGFKHQSQEPELLYALRLPVELSPGDEASLIFSLYKKFNCHLLAHDYGGGGFLRETLLIQAGFDPSRIMPCVYTHQPNRPIVVYNPPTENVSRHYYSVDKSRSLRLLCAAINADLVRLPKYPTTKEDSVVIYEDFLSLVENRKVRDTGSDSILITKNPKQPDDFCHAFNLSCIAHWHSQQAYPDIAEKLGVTWSGAYSMDEAITNTEW